MNRVGKLGKLQYLISREAVYFAVIAAGEGTLKPSSFMISSIALSTTVIKTIMYI